MTSHYAQHQKGQDAENQACMFLQKQGLTLIERNFRNKLGEIDLIMQDKEHLVFVEVRYRQKTEYGNGIESISMHKQKKIIKAAYCYLQSNRLAEKVACRFDAVGVTDSSNIEWIKDAFRV